MKPYKHSCTRINAIKTPQNNEIGFFLKASFEEQSANIKNQRIAQT